MEVPAPEVAVCIPARRRGARLTGLLHALAQDGYPGKRTIYVGLDGPDPALAEEARSAGAEVVTLAVARGSYAARNAVLTSLPESVEIVLFTDADCEPIPGWTAAHVSALQDADLSAGAIRFEFDGNPTPAEFVDSVRNLQQERYVRQGGWAATANLGVRREILGAGFDSNVRSGGDQSFCRRAVEAGGRLVYTPQAVVQHPARGARELLTKSFRVARGLLEAESPPSSRPRSLRPSRSVLRLAAAESLETGPIWRFRAVLMDWATAAVISLAHRVALVRRRGLLR